MYNLLVYFRRGALLYQVQNEGSNVKTSEQENDTFKCIAGNHITPLLPRPLHQCHGEAAQSMDYRLQALTS